MSEKEPKFIDPEEEKSTPEIREGEIVAMRGSDSSLGIVEGVENGRAVVALNNGTVGTYDVEELEIWTGNVKKEEIHNAEQQEFQVGQSVKVRYQGNKVFIIENFTEGSTANLYRKTNPDEKLEGVNLSLLISLESQVTNVNEETSNEPQVDLTALKENGFKTEGFDSPVTVEAEYDEKNELERDINILEQAGYIPVKEAGFETGDFVDFDLAFKVESGKIESKNYSGYTVVIITPSELIISHPTEGTKHIHFKFENNQDKYIKINKKSEEDYSEYTSVESANLASGDIVNIQTVSKSKKEFVKDAFYKEVEVLSISRDPWEIRIKLSGEEKIVRYGKSTLVKIISRRSLEKEEFEPADDLNLEEGDLIDFETESKEGSGWMVNSQNSENLVLSKDGETIILPWSDNIRARGAVQTRPPKDEDDSPFEIIPAEVPAIDESEQDVSQFPADSEKLLETEPKAENDQEAKESKKEENSIPLEQLYENLESKRNAYVAAHKALIEARKNKAGRVLAEMVLEKAQADYEKARVAYFKGAHKAKLDFLNQGASQEGASVPLDAYNNFKAELFGEFTDEQDKLAALRLENLGEKEKGWFRTIMAAYMKQPAWKRILISAGAGTALTLALGTPVAGLGILGIFGAKAVRTTIGLTAGSTVGALVRRGLSADSRRKEKKELEKIRNEFEIPLFDAETEEMKPDSVIMDMLHVFDKDYKEAIEKKEKRNRNVEYWAMGAAFVAGGAAGIASANVLEGPLGDSISRAMGIGMHEPSHPHVASGDNFGGHGVVAGNHAEAHAGEENAHLNHDAPASHLPETQQMHTPLGYTDQGEPMFSRAQLQEIGHGVSDVKPGEEINWAFKGAGEVKVDWTDDDTVKIAGQAYEVVTKDGHSYIQVGVDINHDGVADPGQTTLVDLKTGMGEFGGKMGYALDQKGAEGLVLRTHAMIDISGDGKAENAFWVDENGGHMSHDINPKGLFIDGKPYGEYSPEQLKDLKIFDAKIEFRAFVPGDNVNLNDQAAVAQDLARQLAVAENSNYDFNGDVMAVDHARLDLAQEKYAYYLGEKFVGDSDFFNEVKEHGIGVKTWSSFIPEAQAVDLGVAHGSESIATGAGAEASHSRAAYEATVPDEKVLSIQDRQAINGLIWERGKAGFNPNEYQVVSGLKIDEFLEKIGKTLDKIARGEISRTDAFYELKPLYDKGDLPHSGGVGPNNMEVDAQIRLGQLLRDMPLSDEEKALTIKEWLRNGGSQGGKGLLV